VKLTINSAALRAAAEMAVKVVSSRPTVPILGGVTLTAGDGQLTVRATDGDCWLQTSYPADVQMASMVAVSGRLLAQVTAAMPAGDLDLVNESGVLRVTGSGRARSSLPTMPAEDFPAWPQAPEEHLRRVGGSAFAAALDSCARVATNASIGAPHIRRVTLEPGRDGLRLLASDAYRLLCMDLPWADAGDLGDLLPVPLDPGTVGPMVMLAKQIEQVTLAFDPHGARFQLGAGSARAIPAIVGGKGVEYARGMGQVVRERSAVFDSRELLNLAVKVTPFGVTDGPKDLPLAIVTLTDGECRMQAGTEADGSVEDGIPTSEWTGEDWRAGINPIYLSDALRAMAPGPVRLSVSSPRKPVHLAPADRDTAQAVLMPVRLPEVRQA
jgi:DNA polymerase-3 subunit beta